MFQNWRVQEWPGHVQSGQLLWQQLDLRMPSGLHSHRQQDKGVRGRRLVVWRLSHMHQRRYCPLPTRTKNFLIKIN